MENDQSGTAETRQNRREKKLRKKRERVPKHGRGLAEMYRRVILKRLRGGGKK
ncbi:MAG TPA: hypothetical protein G4O07_03510 [Dehalococcoidia bacterium]|nr:hypothetical protein [Dehalococcoidia bacterium]